MTALLLSCVLADFSDGSGGTVTAVSLDEVKRWVGVAASETAFDDLLEDLIASATETVQQITGRTLLEDEKLLWLDRFSDPITLPHSPVSAVSAVEYYDADGVLQTVDSAVYALDLVSTPQAIVLNEGEGWPATRTMVNAVKVTYTAGYAADPSGVPTPLREAIKHIVAAKFDNRTAGIPDAAMGDLNPYRRMVL